MWIICSSSSRKWWRITGLGKKSKKINKLFLIPPAFLIKYFSFHPLSFLKLPSANNTGRRQKSQFRSQWGLKAWSGAKFVSFYIYWSCTSVSEHRRVPVHWSPSAVLHYWSLAAGNLLILLYIYGLVWSRQTSSTLFSVALCFSIKHTVNNLIFIGWRWSVIWELLFNWSGPCDDLLTQFLTQLLPPGPSSTPPLIPNLSIPSASLLLNHLWPGPGEDLWPTGSWLELRIRGAQARTGRGWDAPGWPRRAELRLLTPGDRCKDGWIWWWGLPSLSQIYSNGAAACEKSRKLQPLTC